MFKKLFCIMMIAALCFALVACDEGEPEDYAAQTPDGVEQYEADESVDEAIYEDEDADAEYLYADVDAYEAEIAESASDIHDVLSELFGEDFELDADIILNLTVGMMGINVGIVSNGYLSVTRDGDSFEIAAFMDMGALGDDIELYLLMYGTEIVLFRAAVGDDVIEESGINLAELWDELDYYAELDAEFDIDDLMEFVVTEVTETDDAVITRTVIDGAGLWEFILTFIEDEIDGAADFEFGDVILVYVEGTDGQPQSAAIELQLTAVEAGETLSIVATLEFIVTAFNSGTQV